MRVAGQAGGVPQLGGWRDSAQEGAVDQSLYVIAKGNLAGELGFLDGLEHSATLRSIGPTELFSLERSRLEALLDEQPKLVYQVMRAVIRSVHSTLRRMNVQYVELTNYINKQHGRY